MNESLAPFHWAKSKIAARACLVGNFTPSGWNENRVSLQSHPPLELLCHPTAFIHVHLSPTRSPLLQSPLASHSRTVSAAISSRLAFPFFFCPFPHPSITSPAKFFSSTRLTGLVAGNGAPSMLPALQQKREGEGGNGGDNDLENSYHSYKYAPETG